MLSTEIRNLSSNSHFSLKHSKLGLLAGTNTTGHSTPGRAIFDDTFPFICFPWVGSMRI